MIYSSKRVEDLNPPVQVYHFQPYIKVEELNLETEQIDTKVEFSRDIKFLGKINNLYYHYVPDNVTLAEQPEQAEVTKLDSVDPDILQQLTSNGEFAVNSRYVNAVQNLLPLDKTYEERNLANIWQAISDISVVLSRLLEMMPMTAATDTATNNALDTIKAFRAKSDALQQQLQKMGL